MLRQNLNPKRFERSDAPRSGDDGWRRVLRGQNRWKSSEQCGHHPYPGTHPMVVTTEHDWGGWRVPGAEYDLDPYRIEQQAQVIVRAPVFLKLIEEFVQHAEQEPPVSP